LTSKSKSSRSEMSTLPAHVANMVPTVTVSMLGLTSIETALVTSSVAVVAIAV
jgi:hypothetical protein